MNQIIEPDIWIDRPIYGGAVEIAITTWDYTGQFGVAPCEEWPGQHSGTQLRCAYAYDGIEGRTLGVLTRHLLPNHPITLAAERSRPKDDPIILDSPERRPFMFVETKNGSLGIVEYAID